jgi:hypothetical protein
MVIIFAKMAELDHLQQFIQKSKDKEATTGNIVQLFQHMTMKQLIGLEALCLLFENPHVIHQLITNDQIQSLMFALEIINKNLNLLLLLDLRTTQQMLSNEDTFNKPIAKKNGKQTLW